MLSEKVNQTDIRHVIIRSVRRKRSEAQVPLLAKSISQQRRSAGQFLCDVNGTLYHLSLLRDVRNRSTLRRLPTGGAIAINENLDHVKPLQVVEQHQSRHR